MRNRKNEALPFNTIHLVSTWLTAKETANLAWCSTELFWMLTGIDLNKPEHRRALDDLSIQLKITAPSRTFAWFQSAATQASITEFIINIARKKNTLNTAAKKVATENAMLRFKNDSFRTFMIETLQSGSFFSLLLYTIHNLRIHPVAKTGPYLITLFFITNVLNGRLCYLKDIFSKCNLSADHDETLRLKTTMLKPVDQLARLSRTNPLTGEVPKISEYSATP